MENHRCRGHCRAAVFVRCNRRGVGRRDEDGGLGVPGLGEGRVAEAEVVEARRNGFADRAWNN